MTFLFPYLSLLSNKGEATALTFSAVVARIEADLDCVHNEEHIAHCSLELFRRAKLHSQVVSAHLG